MNYKYLYIYDGSFKKLYVTLMFIKVKKKKKRHCLSIFTQTDDKKIHLTITAYSNFVKNI